MGAQIKPGMELDKKKAALHAGHMKSGTVQNYEIQPAKAIHQQHL